jgi:hypothetical protein
MDPVKAALFIHERPVVQNGGIPVVIRHAAFAISNTLWDSTSSPFSGPCGGWLTGIVRGVKQGEADLKDMMQHHTEGRVAMRPRTRSR